VLTADLNTFWIKAPKAQETLMIDNFNSILMPFNAESKLSGAGEQAANFAALENTSLETGRLADVMTNSTSQNQFNQMLHSKLNSIITEPKPSERGGTQNHEISKQELTQIVKALREQLENIKRANSQAASENNTKATNSQDQQLLSDLAQELNRLVNQLSPNEQTGGDAANLPAWLAQKMRGTAAGQTDTNQQAAEVTAAENKHSKPFDVLQWLAEPEKLAELSAAEINQLLATNIEQASPKQLEALAQHSGLSVEQLKKMGQLATSQLTEQQNEQQVAVQETGTQENSGQNNSAQERATEQPVTASKTEPMIELIDKLEQLIKPLANNDQLQTQLQQLKQAVADADINIDDSGVTTSKIEQLVEQRVSQPIGALINQTVIQLDGGKSVSGVDDSSVSDDIEQQIKSLINDLPVKVQQQLAAAVTENSANAEQQSKAAQQAIQQEELTKLQRGELAQISASVAKALEQSRSHNMETSTVGSTTASAALSDMSAATMVSNQVNLNTKQQARSDNSQGESGLNDQELEDQEFDELAAVDNNELAQKNKSGDNIDRLLKQFEPRITTQSQANNTPAAVAAELASAQASELDASDAQVLATKEPTASQKVTAEQQLAKLPLGHDAQAARVLKEHMSLMVKGDIQQAIIQLDPEELGGMSIRMQLQNDQMSVQFQVQNAQAKDLLENAMNKLREMLDQQGIVLSDSDVQHQDSTAQHEETEQQAGVQEADFDSDQEVIVLTLNKQSADGIDYYA